MSSSYRALKAFIEGTPEWDKLDDAAVTAALAEPQPVPVPITESALLGGLSVESIGKLLAWPNLGLLKADIAAQNTVGLAVWLGLLPAAGILKSEEAQAIGAALGSPTMTTDGGPTLAETVPGWRQVATEHDVAAARKFKPGDGK